MATKVVESPDGAHELQVRLVRQGIAYGFGIIATVAALISCGTMSFLWARGMPTAGRASLPGILFVITVFFVTLIGILAAACYKLIPLYLQYRRTKKQDEEMFP